MRRARYVAWGGFAVSVGSLVALLALVAVAGRPRRESIVRDPVSSAPNVEPNAGATPPAAVRTAPAAQIAGNGDKRRPKVATPIEPWTGEDLAPTVAASQALMLKVDTADPWDPNVHHRFEPRELHPYEDVYGRSR